MTFYAESLALRRELQDRPGTAQSLEAVAGVAMVHERPERAARLFGAADALREAVGVPAPPSRRARNEQALRTVRAALADEAFAAAWAAGRAMSLEQAIEYAMTVAEAPSATAEPAEQSAADKASDPLTPREREVAALVARGLTDAQLAEVLVIGRRTAEKHVAHCLGKLGLTTRAGLAAWAVEQGLAAARPA